MTIRAATLTDLPEIMRLIHLKADFDGCPQSVRATPETLKDTLFASRPMAYVLLAEVVTEKNAEEKNGGEKNGRQPYPIGFASYHFTYSTFLAQPCLWLDDLFIERDYRNQSIGAQLIATLRSLAKEHDCGRIDWTVDVENAAGIRFYQRMGAQLQTQVHLCRLNLFP